MHSQFQNLVSRYPPSVITLADQARSLVLAHCPGVSEEIDMPANMAAYSYGKGYKHVICTIILSKQGVKLGFYKGSELPDPDKLLEGKGKVHKYVAITSAASLRSKALTMLLKAAVTAYRDRISGTFL